MSPTKDTRPTCPTCKKRMSEAQYAGHICPEVVRRIPGETFGEYCARVEAQLIRARAYR